MVYHLLVCSRHSVDVLTSSIGIFFADVLGIYDVYQGNGPALSSGAQIPHLDVSYMISAMAAVSCEPQCGS